MGIFKRIKDVSRANVHEWLDKIEDPVVMLHQYIRDMQEEISKAEVVCAKQMASERMIKQRLADAEAKALYAERRAEEALVAGQEETARAFLEDKIRWEEQAAELAHLHSQAKANADELLAQLQEMKNEFYRMQNRKNELKQRAELAQAKKRTAEVLVTHRLDASSASAGFRRIEEKILQWEAEADVKRMLVTNPVYTGTAVPTMPADPAKQLRVEAELARLKEKQAAQS